MCPPVIAIAALAVSVGGMIYGAIKDKKASDAAEAQANKNQEEANRLANVAEYQGEYEAATIRQKANQIMGAQANKTIGGGFALTGTAARILESTEMLSEQDVNVARMNAAQIAMGYRKQGLQFAAQADIIRQKSGSQLAGTILGAGGQVLSTAGNIWKYYDASTTPSTPSSVLSGPTNYSGGGANING